ncbi:hypothetical protein VTK73DRAFT_1363 [Phialemonium thermophilum]|uniref:Carboxylic ester hydrolase n=1 Tax=Phialemonium thermophilum TaxID=223376 RepID=A0ABR3XAP8_9PEZI
MAPGRSGFKQPKVGESQQGPDAIGELLEHQMDKFRGWCHNYSLLSSITTAAILSGSRAAPHICGRSSSLKPITDWGNNPTNLELQVYEPNRLAKHPAIILALHICGSSGPEYAEFTNYNSLADQYGFVVLYPSTKNDFNCWDGATNATLTRDGGGDSTGLANMVRWAIVTYQGGSSNHRYATFIVGSSSGCMMVNLMCAAYPDLFAAASCYSGVPVGCIAGSPGSSPQEADPACPEGRIILSGARWAAWVHSIDPGYRGPYPRIQLWHGAVDPLISVTNLGEELKQWSYVFDIEFSHNETDVPGVGYTKMVYGNGTRLLGYLAEWAGHPVPVDPTVDLKWFGIL